MKKQSHQFSSLQSQQHHYFTTSRPSYHNNHPLTHPYHKKSLKTQSPRVRNTWRRQMSTQQGENAQNAAKSAPGAAVNNAATNTMGTHKGPLPPPPPGTTNASKTTGEQPHDHFPKLEQFLTKEVRDEFTSQTWKAVKLVLAVYFVAVLTKTFALRAFCNLFHNMTHYSAIQDIQRYGSASMWTIPLLHQDRAFSLQFDPKYPALNHYNLRIFVLKELEASFSAADQMYDNSYILLNNCQLRVQILDYVIKRGWATSVELTAIMDGNDNIVTRELTDDERIQLFHDQGQVNYQYEKRLEELQAEKKIYDEEKRKKGDESTGLNQDKNGEKQYNPYEEELLLRLDISNQIGGRINFSKQQLLYLQRGRNEFEKVVSLAEKLMELSAQMRTASAATVWRLHYSGDQWNFPFTKMTDNFHELAATALATAKLNDALLALSTTNIEQILQFMHYFDKNIEFLNDPEEMQKMKYKLPSFPSLVFEVPTSTQYSAQLATLKQQARAMHDPLYDPARPFDIVSDSGVVLNPGVRTPPQSDDAAATTTATSFDTNKYIPYVSPARPSRPTALPYGTTDLSASAQKRHDEILFLREKFNISPTFEEEVEYSQNMMKTQQYDTFGGMLAQIQQNWTKDRQEKEKQKEKERAIKDKISALGGMLTANGTQ